MDKEYKQNVLEDLSRIRHLIDITTTEEGIRLNKQGSDEIGHVIRMAMDYIELDGEPKMVI